MARPGRHRQHQRLREAPAPRYAPTTQGAGIAGVLLDSDVIIEILRGRAETAAQLLSTEDLGIPTHCCAIAWAEVMAGSRPGEAGITEMFFQARGEVVIDAETGRRAGGYLSRYAKSHEVEIVDALVAAAASTTGLHLWTLNRKHYPMDDIRFYDPGGR